MCHTLTVKQDVMKPNRNNYSLLCRVMYEFTGLQHWLRKPSEISLEISMGLSFFSLYWNVYHEVKKSIEAGEVCRFNLIRFGTGGQKLPFIINSLPL